MAIKPLQNNKGKHGSVLQPLQLTQIPAEEKLHAHLHTHLR